MRSTYHHLYNTAAWRRLRVAQLQAYPLCRMDQELGRFVAAAVVDHIKPHKGEPTLFSDPANLQSLCKQCHDSHKQAQEHNADGILRGAGITGRPLDLAHPWHKPARPPGVGGVQISSGSLPKTAWLSPFAKPQNG